MEHLSGFDYYECFHDSDALFKDLWSEWLTVQVLMLADGTSLDRIDFIDGIGCRRKSRRNL